ncbi:tetratricopeptide repeat protein [Rhabdobacter roseus]|uniref:Tetratricopeptide (TPR) repeat protein n=1 Tax=Rhabdobacter roseus TaxID=1655419 RepID=A0A840TPL7_9BACT|nr:tetratricopeptide repeat protein [Rhabdobacter roseus]MBB5283173.1 tetratricopeptide (TPR) repeat protein [Rhabdobacter roseus]
MFLKRSLIALILCLGGGCCAVNAQSTLSYTAPEAHYRNGLEYFEKSNFVAARQEFAEYLKRQDKLLNTSDYNSVTAEYYIAVTGLYLNYPEAEVQVDRFVRNHAEHPKAQLIFSDLGRYYYEAGEYDKAIGYLEKSVQATSNVSKKQESVYRLAMSYYNTQRFKEALPLFNQIKEDNAFENAGDAAYYAGVISYRAGNYQEAYQDFLLIENHAYYKNEVPNWIVSSLYQLKKYDELLQYGERTLNTQRGNTKLDDVALYVAEVYYEKGDYKGAVTAYERYKRLNRGTLPPTVALHYGHAQFRSENYAGAVEAMKGIATGKDSVAQYAAYLVGISYLQQSNPAYARTAFENAARLTFNPVVQEEAAFNHAKVQLELGSNNEAIKEFNDFLAKYPSSRHEEETTQLIAEAYSGASNNAGAITYIEGLRKRSPAINATYQRLTYNQGVVDFNQERYQQAIVNFDKSLKYPIDEEIFVASNYLKGDAFSALNRYDDAIPIYNQLTKNPKAGIYGRKSLYALGYAYYNQKNYARAQGYFKDFVKNLEGIESQVIEDAHVRLADTYMAGKSYSEAIRTYDEVSAKGKVDKDYALLQKGRAYVYMSREQEAKRQFELLISQFPNSRYVEDALFQIADLDFQNKAYQQAVRSFTRLINERPKSPVIPAALLRRGQAYYNIGVHEQAIVDFRRILTDYSSSPSAGSALEGIQESFNAVGRPEEFTQILAIVRKNNPGNTKLEEVEFDNARNLFYAERYDKAREAFQAFLKSYPGSNSIYDAKYFIGASYEKTDDIQQALQYYTMVVQDNRSSFVASAAQKSAELQIARGNYRDAVGNFRVLLRNAENKKEQTIAWIGLMDTYFTLKSYDSTLHYAREVVNVGNIVPGGVGKAQLYFGKVPYERGDYAKATEEFKKVAATSKDAVGAESKYWLSMILYKDKKYQEAEKVIFELSKEFEGEDYWRVRSFILLADVYMGMNEVAQAKATLSSIIENSDDQEAVGLAKTKLAEIDRK